MLRRSEFGSGEEQCQCGSVTVGAGGGGFVTVRRQRFWGIGFLVGRYDCGVGVNLFLSEYWFA